MIAQLSTVLLLIVALAGSFQQAAPWTPPHKIETPTQSNWFPSVAVDPYGDVHLIWSSGKGLGEEAFDLLMYTRLRAGEWSTSNDIVQTGTGGWAARNSLAIDRNGRLHLLVRNRGAIYYASASAADAGSAQAWQSLRRMNGMGQPYYSTIAIDAGGVLHVVWEELSPKLGEDGCEGCSDIWYRQSTDGGATWSAPTNLSNGRSGAIKPKIVFKAPDQVYVSWDEGKDPNSPVGEPVGIAFAVSHDGGKRWDAPQRMTIRDDAAQQATLGIDGGGTLLLLFRSTTTNALQFRTSGDGGSTWSDAAALGSLQARDLNDTPWDTYSMATDSAGNVHLLVVARPNGTQPVPALYHLVWSRGDQRWSAPEIVSSSADYPEWPQLIVANGNQLHAAWFTRSARDLHDSDHASYQVWYSTRTVDAPGVPVVVPPTPDVPPTATPEPPLPTAAPPDPPLADWQREAPLPSAVRSEVPMLQVLGGALLPALAVLAVALLLGLRVARSRPRGL